jgi:hypothetical protein
LDFIKTAKFSTLFLVSFSVSVAANLVLALAGLVLAIAAPESFALNDQAATGLAQAILAEAILLGALVILSALVSLVGSATLMVVRVLLVRQPHPKTDIF